MDFTENLISLTASVTIEKCVFNSVVSTPGVRCLLADIKHFYLKNILPDQDLMRIPLKIIPQEINGAHNLATMVYNQELIYMRIKKGMYGLKQSRIIAHQELVKHMDPFEYHPVQHTHGLWFYDNRDTIFILVVNVFFVQYSSMKNPDHF